MKEPQDRQSEMGVLAGMMNDTDCYYEAMSVLTSDCFTTDEHISLFNRMVKKGEVMGANALVKEVESTKEKALVRTIDSAFQGIEPFQVDIEKVKDTYIKRQLHYTMQNAFSRMDTAHANELVSMIERDIGRMMFDDKNENIIDPATRAANGLEHFYEKMENPDKFKGIPYTTRTDQGKRIGFPSLDEVFNGAQGGDIVMIAAKTGEGKTALAVTLARLFSLFQPYYGYYQNTEMRIDEMESRLLAPLTAATSKEIYYGRLQGSEAEQRRKVQTIGQAYEVYRRSHLYLSRIPSLPLHKSKGLARQMRNRYGRLDYLIVDYIGRMDLSDRERNMQQWDVMYEIIKQLKELAMELNIPIFVLAQRNQAGEVEGAKKMMNECDGVLFFEPCGEDDQEVLERTYSNPDKRKIANYKIVKKKVRRDDNAYPIFCVFDKAKQFINEIPTDGVK